MERMFAYAMILAGALVAPVAVARAAAAAPGPDASSNLVFRAEFNGADADLDKAWTFQNGPSTHILCSRWRGNVTVTNGCCRLMNRKESRGGQQWTSGSMLTRRRFLYGYFECRYRYAAAKATNSSFWLMTADKLPPGAKSFEIDINEGHYPNQLNTNIHNHSDQMVVKGRRTHPTSSKAFSYKGHDFAREFHVYGLEWTKDELVFYLDGREIRRVKNAFCHSPSPVWLSEAIISWAGQVTDAIDGTAMEVDYVRVYRRRP